MIKVCWFNKKNALQEQTMGAVISKGIHNKVTEFYNSSEDGDFLILYEDNKPEVTWKNNGGYVSIVE